MTTYISLASSATMFPVGSPILTSELTPELVKARMEKVQVVSALNESHKSTIDVVKRRYGLELPLPVLEPGQRAPQVKLQPGDELFIVQASLSRLKEGEKHSDETVQKAPISFLRWRVPARVDQRAPRGLSQLVFERVIDIAHAVALWQRGADSLMTHVELIKVFEKELEELQWSYVEIENLMLGCGFDGRETIGKVIDLYLEGGDLLYKGICEHYVTGGDPSLASLYWRACREIEERFLSLDIVTEMMLRKMYRRSTGAPKDAEAERRLCAPVTSRTASYK